MNANEGAGMPGRKISRKEWLLFAAVILVALALRLHFFLGASVEDDLGFTGYANQVAHGYWENGNDQALRRMTYAPMALAYYLFGMNVFSTQYYHMTCGLMTIATAFFLARRYFGLAAAVGAGLFLAFIPLHIFYSSRTMPSLPETLWGGLGVWLLCSVEDRRLRGASALAPLSYAGVGILIGAAYLCRETGIVMMGVPLAFLGLAVLRPREKTAERLGQLLLVLAGFLLILVFEAWMDYGRTYDWFHRWHVVSQTQGRPGTDYVPWHFYLDQLLNIYPSQGFIGFSAASWLRIPKFRLNDSPHFLGFMGYVIFVSVVAYAWKAARGPQKIILFWFLAYFLFLSFAVASFSPYVPIRKFNRYQLLFLTPASIMAGWFLAALWRKNRLGKLAVLGGALLLIGASLYYTHQEYLPRRSYYRGAVELRQAFRRHVHSEIPIYIDEFEGAVQDMWDGYHSPYHFWSLAGLLAPPTEESYIVVTRTLLNGDYATDYLNKPFLTTIPAGWVKIAEIKLRRWEYFKFNRYPVIFYVPPQETHPPPPGELHPTDLTP